MEIGRCARTVAGMKRLKLASIIPVILFASSCQTNQAMWASCVAGNDPWGTDGKYVLGCKDGEWIPVMTVDEYIAIQQGKKVTIAPVPTRPTTTTTTTTAAPATTSTTTSTTSTTTSTIPTTQPAITGLNAAGGPVAGGQTLSILGSGFTGVTAVTFDGVNVASFTIVDDEELSVVTPAGSAGAIDIVVTNPSGSATSAGDYEYMIQPVVASISPDNGPEAGGTVVTITGPGVGNAGTVTFGSVPGTGVTRVSATSLTVVAPAGTGTVNVRVNSWGGLSDPTNDDEYTYT